MRAVPLYPEFFEDVRSAAYELTTDAETVDSPEGRIPDQFAAPWIGAQLPGDQEHEVRIDLGSLAAAGRAPTPANLVLETGRFTATESPGVDAVAAYFPWHFFEASWGIRIYERPFYGFAADLASLAGHPLPTMLPIVLLEVLQHEWTHFAFEVAATEIEDVVDYPLYGSYSRTRYARPTDWSTGPLEEAVATWAELSSPRSGFRRR